MVRAAYALEAVALACCLTCDTVVAQPPSSDTTEPAAADNAKTTQTLSPDKKTKMRIMTDCTKQAKKQKLDFAMSKAFMKECMSKL